MFSEADRDLTRLSSPAPGTAARDAAVETTNSVGQIS